MGKAKEPYWTYVKTIIKEYPDLKKKLAIPLEQRVTSFIGLDGGKKRTDFRSYSGMCHSRPAAERAEKAGSHRGRDSEDKETASRGRGAEIKGHQPGLLEKIPYDRRGGHESSPRHRNVAGNWQESLSGW